LEVLERSGNPDTFVVSVEPLLIHMLARNPTNVIDFQYLSADLLRDLRADNPKATFFYLEQDIHNSRADSERYHQPFGVINSAQKRLLARDDHFAIYELL
jgi:hypothetical protein